MPTSTVEDYLKCILQEQQKGNDLVPMGKIAGNLGVASGTVTAMVKTLAESGLVHYAPYSGVELTDAGRQLATRVLRRHRLIELFLVEIMGVDWGFVHEEAEHLEHAVSDRLVERMDEMLGHPAVDPHGDPIPTAQGEFEESDAEDLLNCTTGRRLRVTRVRDQSSSFLRLVEDRGLRPGNVVEIEKRDPAAETVAIRLEESGTSVGLGFGAAAKILVEPA